MPGSIYAWSTTAASNDTADGDINWQEGQFPDTVNNSARQMMGRVAEFRNDLSGTLVPGGTANALTITANSAFTALADGLILSFRAGASNTGAVTANVNSLGSKAIRKMDSTGDVALAANDIRQGGIYYIQYSAAADTGTGGWLMLNPTLSAALYALSSLTTTDNAIARYDGTSGKFQNSGVIINDSNNVSGVGTLSTSGSITTSGALTASSAVFGSSFFFTADTDTGVSTALPNQISLIVGGVSRVGIDSTGIDVSGAVLASTPGGFKFRTDTDTGMASTAAGRIDFFCDGGLAASMFSNGDFTASGNITASSDEKFKTNWQEFGPNFIDRLATVKAGTYDRTDVELRQVGVGAQSLQPVLPWAVREGDDGNLSVAYGQAALASCVYLAREIVALKKRLPE